MTSQYIKPHRRFAVSEITKNLCRVSPLYLFNSRERSMHVWVRDRANCHLNLVENHERASRVLVKASDGGSGTQIKSKQYTQGGSFR